MTRPPSGFEPSDLELNGLRLPDALALPGAPAPASPDRPPARTGLDPDERAQLNDLRTRVDRQPYPAILDSGWDPAQDEVERKARLLLDWLSSLAARPNLDGDTRATLRRCRAHVDLARWVLSDPELGPAYLRAVRTRNQEGGSGA